MGLAYWDDIDGAWDTLKLGQDNMPGVWEITSGECARQVDHKKTKDKDGARIKDLGLLPARFSARGRMIDKADWTTLQRIIPDINPRKKGGPKFPLAIFHPATALLGITTIYVERVRAPEIKDGILEIQIDMIEWTAEPKAVNTSKKPAVPSGYIGTDEDAKILAAQNQNWGLRRGGVLAGTPQGNDLNVGDVGLQPPPFEKTSDEEFARLTGEDTRHPPSESLSAIDPSTNPL